MDVLMVSWSKKARNRAELDVSNLRMENRLINRSLRDKLIRYFRSSVFWLRQRTITVMTFKTKDVIAVSEYKVAR